jgi:hypothetical protein
LPEVIGQVVRRRSQTLHITGKPGKRSLAGRTGFALVLDTVEPYLERGIEFDEGTTLKAEHEIVAYDPKEALMRTSA